MAIQTYWKYIVPVLKTLSSAPNGELSKKDLIRILIDDKKIRDFYPDTTDEDFIVRYETTKDVHILEDRIGWATSYSKTLGFISSPQRAYLKIIDLGLKNINISDEEISKLISKLHREYKNNKKNNDNVSSSKSNSDYSNSDDTDDNIEQFTDNQLFESSVQKNKQEIQNEIRSRLFPSDENKDWKEFEKFCLKLLEKMGYGVDRNSFKHTGKPGDGGFDGIVYEDKLGLSKIFIQAKYYKEGNNINADTIKSFLYSVSKEQQKGVFITTSDYTSQARAEIASQKNVKFLNGNELLSLMYEHQIGLRVKATYELLDIDEDFFE